MDVRFPCPECNTSGSLRLPDERSWQCPGCDHLVRPASTDPSGSDCPLCGNTELYKKKDFPHWLGMSILVGACAASFLTYGWYQKYWTWAILIGSALFDGLLYWWVGDVVVCYRCQAHLRGMAPNEAHHPHDLGTAERYRQERLRRELLKLERNQPPAP